MKDIFFEEEKKISIQLRMEIFFSFKFGRLESDFEICSEKEKKFIGKEEGLCPKGAKQLDFS